MIARPLMFLIRNFETDQTVNSPISDKTLRRYRGGS